MHCTICSKQYSCYCANFLLSSCSHFNKIASWLSAGPFECPAAGYFPIQQQTEELQFLSVIYQSTSSPESKTYLTGNRILKPVDSSPCLALLQNSNKLWECILLFPPSSAYLSCTLFSSQYKSFFKEKGHTTHHRAPPLAYPNNYTIYVTLSKSQWSSKTCPVSLLYTNSAKTRVTSLPAQKTIGTLSNFQLVDQNCWQCRSSFNSSSILLIVSLIGLSILQTSDTCLQFTTFDSFSLPFDNLESVLTFSFDSPA